MERSPGEGKGYPLQYSGLENFTDCIVHGVTKRTEQVSLSLSIFQERQDRALTLCMDTSFREQMDGAEKH